MKAKTKNLLSAGVCVLSIASTLMLMHSSKANAHHTNPPSEKLGLVPDEVRAEIKLRCQDEMAAYGSYMILSCAQQDMKSYVDIEFYRTDYPEVIDRCEKSFGQDGYWMVKNCIDMDLVAKEVFEKL